MIGCLLSKPKLSMTSLCSTAVLAKAKADIWNESVQSYSFLETEITKYSKALRFVASRYSDFADTQFELDP